jgi:elongation factor P
MNSETFEEVPVDVKVIDDKVDWLEEGMEINLVFFKEKPIECVVPQKMVYKIVETEPSVKGNTAGSGHTKPAILSCGATVTVPGYLEEGEMITVDTDKRAFVQRAGD